MNWSQGASDQEQLLENLGIDGITQTQTEAETGDNATPPPVTPGENEVEASETTGTEAAQPQADETAESEEVIFVEEKSARDLPEVDAATEDDVSLAEVTIESPPAENESKDDTPPLAAAEEEQGWTLLHKCKAI